MTMLLLFAALIIIAVLAFYAGSLLFKLKSQNAIREQKTQQRLTSISQSIQTIAMAVEQQQCNLSEGCIRLFHLLEALPINDRPNFSEQYQGVYALYEQVKNLPTHQARAEQSKAEIRQQDKLRESFEKEHHAQILTDMQQLKSFSVESHC